MGNRHPLLEIRGLRVEREVVILDGLDWTIGRGEHWAVLGPNGCGKTSILRVCCGYLAETAGSVRDAAELAGRDGEQPRRERIGIVSHSLQGRIEPRQTVEEVLLSGRRARLNDWTEADPSERARLRRLLREVDLADKADRWWGQLSQGERQRALLGRACWSRLPLLFLDEPCAGLDPVAREGFLATLERLCGQTRGPGIVLVTHHVEEIVPAITHVLLLRAGRVVAAGPKAEVLTSRNLAATFGAPVRLLRDRASGRFRMKVTSAFSASNWFQH